MYARLKHLVPRRIGSPFRRKKAYCQPSYAQEGEDRILWSLLAVPDRASPGFYVDVGAHHPQRFSNTYLFYLHGWSGINVDAMPGSMKAFRRDRHRDINIEAGVSANQEFLTFYEFDEPALNGCSRATALTRDHYRGWKIINERQIETTRLDALLARHLPKGQKIDFMSVDVEGLDMEVLTSNDWNMFRPLIVLVENSEGQLVEQADDSSIPRFMKGKGYTFCCKTPLTSFFIEHSKIENTPLGLRLTETARGK